MREHPPVTKGRRNVLLVVAAPLVVIALVSAAWGISAAITGDSVARNTAIGGTQVGGDSPAELRSAVSEMNKRFQATEIQISTGDATLTDTAGNLGLSLNTESTIAAATGVGRTDAIPVRPARWIGSFFGSTELSAPVAIDGSKLQSALVTLEGKRRTDPVEPRIEADADGVRVIKGVPGKALTTTEIAAAIPARIAKIGTPISVKVQQATIPPLTADAKVEALAAAAQKVTDGTITLTSGTEKVELRGKDLRTAFSLVAATSANRDPQLKVDPAVVAKLVESSTGKGANPTGVRFTIQGGVPVPVPGKDAVVCCGPEAPKLIADALLAGKTSVEVPTRTVTADEGVQWANTLGVKSVIGQFTTQHPAGQPRVTNIHRISDITRGVLIPPGETFSVNGFVGRRTTADGFVSAPAINDGKFVDDIGGGVSQYATTLFNAAFFGGLDIPAYKPHSIYIGRYPFGREATLAYPSVDLKVRNNSKYGVVIWPSYTATSVTMQLWSTKFATGEQTAQSTPSGTPSGPAAPARCGRVVTTRTRTFTDGRTSTDRFYANYNCNPPKH